MSREVTFTASNFDSTEFSHFISILKKLDLHVNVNMSASGKTATVRAYDLPDSTYEMKSHKTSEAGRPHKRIELPEGSVFNGKTTCMEFIEYKQNHTSYECMEQLGIDSRATYYRKLKAIEQAIRAYDSNVAYNKAHDNGLSAVAPLLTDIE